MQVVCLLVEGLLEAVVDKTGEVSRLTSSLHVLDVHILFVEYDYIEFGLFSSHATPCPYILLLVVKSDRGEDGQNT